MDVETSDIVLCSGTRIYNAIVDQDIMSKYFISRANGALKHGEEVIWYFDEYTLEFVISNIELAIDSMISFTWLVNGFETKVEISIDEIEEQSSIIHIRETAFKKDDEGIARALSQTQGWTDFICCMKAYLYSGINLRRGRERLVQKKPPLE